jgi:homoserine kinase
VTSIIVVPATSGNMGSGFDALGIALDALKLRVMLTKGRAPLRIVTITGEGADSLAKDATNRVLVAATKAAERVGITGLTGDLEIHSDIPLARGLGSSAAAAVAGALVADVASGKKVGLANVLTVASELEGHSDNVAPALHGGVQVSVHVGGEFITCGVPINLPLSAAVYIPDQPLTTKRAREVLPKQVSLEDAVFNVGRAALTVAALSKGDGSLLRESLADKLHQPARTRLMPYLPHLIKAAIDAGAYGAALSGAGTTVCALCPPARVNVIADAMADAAAKHNVPGRRLVSQIAAKGASVTQM